jgi:D-alanyl-D-alanine carboxypeptidase
VNRSVFSRRRWLGLSASLLVLFAAACGTPNAPQTATSASPSAAADTVASASAAASPSPAPESASASASAAAATATPSAPPAAATATPTAAPTVAPTAEPTPQPSEVALQPFDPALAATLQGILDQLVADGTIPGATASVSIRGQEPWSGASGVADRQTGRAMEPDTNVRIASISKIFTAVVVLQLVEEGQIELDAPVSTYLPDLLPNGDAITVRNLLQHTSGLYDYLEDRRFAGQAYQEAQRSFEPRELVNYAAQFPLAFPPNSPGNWDYSSTNYVILGMIAEQVTGNTMAQEVRTRISEPLGLEQTVFAPYEPEPEDTASGYSQGVDQTNVAMSFAYATANIVSTPSEVRRFGEALINGELLEPQTQEQMWTFVSGKGQYNMPALEYGLGLMRNQLPAGQGRSAEDLTVVGHIGGFGGFRSALWASPIDGTTIALGMNQAATDPNILATRLWDAVRTAQGR